nr:hypothetical protein [Saccharopolyspora pogona]
MASTVAGRDISTVDQDEPAAKGFLEVWNMQTQRLSDQRQYASVDPRYGRLAYSEQIAHGRLVQVLPDIYQGEKDRAVKPYNRRPYVFFTTLDDLPNPGNKLLDLVSSKPRSRLVTQRSHL